MIEINETVARKLLTVVDAGLSHGMGDPTPGNMCIEAAVCYALGMPHSDDPKCVARLRRSALRRLKIRLNDSAWSSKTARAKGMRRLALAQLGSAGVLDEAEFVKRVVRLAIQVYVPLALRAAASMKGNKAHKDALESAAAACEAEPTREHAVQARAAADAAADAAYAAADDAAYAAAYAAYAAADAAADDAADAAAYAADAAAYAAYAAAADDAADADAAADAAADADDAARSKKRDEILSDYAERVVQILVDMKAPGCQWLYLTESGATDSKSASEAELRLADQPAKSPGICTQLGCGRAGAVRFEKYGWLCQTHTYEGALRATVPASEGAGK